MRKLCTCHATWLTAITIIISSGLWLGDTSDRHQIGVPQWSPWRRDLHGPTQRFWSTWKWENSLPSMEGNLWVKVSWMTVAWTLTRNPQQSQVQETNIKQCLNLCQISQQRGPGLYNPSLCQWHGFVWFLKKIKEAKKFIGLWYQYTDMGKIEFFLGLHIVCDCSKRTISMDQTCYIQHILKNFDTQTCLPTYIPLSMDTQTCLPTYTPLSMDTILTANPEKESDTSLTTCYQQIVGSLMYTMLGMRLDICFTVNCLEYMALTKCLKHTQWTISLLQQLLSEVNLPINIFIDSTGSKSITLNNIHHKRGTTITVRRLPMEQLASMKLTPMTTSLTSSQRHYHESHMNSSHQDLDSLIIQLREECWKSDDNSWMIANHQVKFSSCLNLYPFWIMKGAA